VDGMELEIEGLKSNASQFDEKLHQLETAKHEQSVKLNDKFKECAELQHKLSDTEAKNRELEEKLNNNSDKVDAAEYEEKLKASRLKFEESESVVAELKKRITELERLLAIKTKAEANSKAIEEAKQRCTTALSAH
jgi:chromosome segregation ATPase